MRRVILLIIAVLLFATPVYAMEFTAPEAPLSADKYMPDDTESFWDGFLSIIKAGIAEIKPGITEAAGVCASLIAIVLLVSILRGFSGNSIKTAHLISTLTIGFLLIRPSGTLVSLGIQTVQEISEYGKMLLPVMTAALAAQGGTTTSAALYTGTTVFNTILGTAVPKLIVPMIYVYIALCIANSATSEDILKKLGDFIKWLITWTLKIILYIFTGYISITGVISGTVDAAAVKATKLAISGFVPVVGSVLSDASETILVSAGLMKNTAGVYGLLAIAAICIEPFLHIGVQYIFLKVTAAICGIYGSKKTVGLINDFATIMGFLLAMTGIVCLIFMVSTVCFMRGITNG